MEITKDTYIKIILILLRTNISAFTFLYKTQQDIIALNNFYSNRTEQIQKNTDDYNEEKKLKVAEKLLSLKKRINDLGSLKLEIEKDKFFKIYNYKEVYKDIYIFANKNRLLNEDNSEWFRKIGQSLYISIDDENKINIGIPRSLGKKFCEDKQMAFCYTFEDESLTYPKYDYTIVEGINSKINYSKIKYLLNNKDKYNTVKEVYAYFNNIKN